MKKLSYTKAHNLSALLDEIQAAVPALRPVQRNGVREAVMSLSGDGATIELWVPDDVDPAPVAAVVAAHTNPPPPDTTPPDFGGDAADLTNYPALRTSVQNLRDYVAVASPTAAQSAGALKLLIRVVLAMLRRTV